MPILIQNGQIRFKVGIVSDQHLEVSVSAPRDGIPFAIRAPRKAEHFQRFAVVQIHREDWSAVFVLLRIRVVDSHLYNLRKNKIAV